MADLTARTGLPVRKLRYVFDHRVLPGLRGTPVGHGIRRTFTDFEGFAIALAANLLDAGLTRKLVAAVFDAACRPAGSTQRPANSPLYRAYLQAGSLEIGDGRFLRVLAPICLGRGEALDTGWLPLGPREPIVGDYTPMMHVKVEVGRLAEAIRA